MSLPERRLGDVLRVALDEESVHVDTKYQIAGVYGFGRGLFRRGPIRGDETSYFKLNRLTAGRLVMSKLKAFEGAIAVIPAEFDGWYMSPEFPTFEIDEEMGADSRYIADLCGWPEFWSRLSAQSKGVGARKIRISAERLMTVKVPLPGLPEQRRIVARLDSALGKLHAISVAQAHAANLRDALTDSLLSNVGELAPLREFLIPATDIVAVEPSEIYQTAGILSYGRGLFARPPIEGTETSYKSYNRIHTGQFVYSKLFGWEGAMATVPPEFDGFYMSHEFPAFAIEDSRADQSYVYHLARWPRLHNSLRDKGTGMGSRRQRVNPERLLSAMVPLPSLPEQRRIAIILDTIAKSGRLTDTQVAQTQYLRSALLNAAFNGQL